MKQKTSTQVLTKQQHRLKQCRYARCNNNNQSIYQSINSFCWSINYRYFCWFCFDWTL